MELNLQQWQNFLRSDYANEILIGVGAVLLLISIISIVKVGFKLAMWVLIAGIGAVSLSYGLKESPYDLPALQTLQLSDIKALVGADHDVLQLLCQKLDQGG